MARVIVELRAVTEEADCMGRAVWRFVIQRSPAATIERDGPATAHTTRGAGRTTLAEKPLGGCRASGTLYNRVPVGSLRRCEPQAPGPHPSTTTSRA
mmetsp:Transcript_102850/g.296180  ORF Transcript_102850/g.296180 Transcript_102850/m.296180 type:complete len:97 (+) Transcript_102850:81-371(+)